MIQIGMSGDPRASDPPHHAVVVAPSDTVDLQPASTAIFIGRFDHRSEGRCINRQWPSAETTPNLFPIGRFPLCRRRSRVCF
jgi:hypothetical protein